MSDRTAFDPSRLGSFSRRFAAALFAAFPQLRSLATACEGVEPDGMSLEVLARSPSGDADRFIQVWVDEEVTPTISFGAYHTHAAPDDDGIGQILALCEAVLTDRVLIIEYSGGDLDGRTGWIDVSDPDALIEAITSPVAPTEVRLKSWSGANDRLVTSANC